MPRKSPLSRAASALLVAGISLQFAAPASAHFIWIHLLREETPPRAEFLFGDGAYNDSDANLVRYAEGLSASSADGQPLAVEVHAWGLEADLPEGTRLVGASKPMGVFTPPGGGENRLLRYTAKGAADLDAAGETLGLETEVLARAEGDELVLQVLFGGEPAAGAEVQVSVLDSTEKPKLEADDAGIVRVPRPTSGLFEARGRVIVPEGGEEDGQEYTTIQHYSTLVIASMRSAEIASGAQLDAYQRLERAFERRECFPAALRGIGGVLKVNADGQKLRGEFDYRVGGPLTLDVEGGDEALEARVHSTVASLLRHRAPHAFEGGDGARPLILAPRDGHPSGRRVDLNDGTTSGYRLFEDEIRAVERVMGDQRVLLSVSENIVTAAGRYLPRHFSVAHFDDAGRLTRTETYTDEYQEIDGVQIPKSRTLTSFEGGGSSTIAIEFRNLELLTEANQ